MDFLPRIQPLRVWHLPPVYWQYYQCKFKCSNKNIFDRRSRTWHVNFLSRNTRSWLILSSKTDGRSPGSPAKVFHITFHTHAGHQTWDLLCTRCALYHWIMLGTEDATPSRSVLSKTMAAAPLDLTLWFFPPPSTQEPSTGNAGNICIPSRSFTCRQKLNSIVRGKV